MMTTEYKRLKRGLTTISVRTDTYSNGTRTRKTTVRTLRPGGALERERTTTATKFSDGTIAGRVDSWSMWGRPPYGNATSWRIYRRRS